MNEEDIKLKFITPSIEKAGWNRNTQIEMEYKISPGRIIVNEINAKRAKPKKADYLLSYKKNLPIAVVEAKDDTHKVSDGLAQAQEYASKLNVRFVFTSNGKAFFFHDMKTGEEKEIPMDKFPSPQELFEKQYDQTTRDNIDFEKIINTPYYFGEGSFSPRYYQRIAINKAVDDIAKGKNRVLLVLATGTGKTYIAFQIIWRLWKAGIKKKVLYLADRNILVDQTITGDFKPFKGSLTKISHRTMDTSYEIYLSLYQQLAESNEIEDPLAILKEKFKPNFFDLIIVDECHRGSAREDSNWRKILDYFNSSTQIGMTATPKETNDVSNIDYFGEPIYTYSLKDGIDDGYLAPYRVIRYGIDIDMEGWRPEEGKTDKSGNLVEDRIYGVKDFDKNIVIDERTNLVAYYITEYLKKTDRMAKTIVFCVDIDHAERMRKALVALNQDLVAKDYRYIMRITGDDDQGKAQVENFQDDNSPYPTIVTTSKLLTTGVNCRNCKNIVLDNNFNPDTGMTEFKQIIGRGTRINEEYGKMYFTILDFRNATRLFADHKFNGPVAQTIDFDPKKSTGTNIDEIPDDPNPTGDDNTVDPNPIPDLVLPDHLQRKVYVNDVEVKLLSERVQYIGEDGKLTTISYKDYTKNNILKEYDTLQKFLNDWSNEERRSAIIKELSNNGVDFETLRRLTKNEVDDFDLICDIAYGIKPLTKSERAKNRKVDEVLANYSDKCKEVLQLILQKYCDSSMAGEELTGTDILNLPDFKEKFGSPMNIAKYFGGRSNYLMAVTKLQNALYAN